MSITVYQKNLSTGREIGVNPLIATLLHPYNPPSPSGYTFEFSVIDNLLSNNPTVTPIDTTATFWYLPTPNGNGQPPPPAVYIWGFDETQNASIPVAFAVTPQGGGASQSFASGQGIVTQAGAFNAVAPAFDDLQNKFQYWYNIGSGAIQNTPVPGTLPLTRNETAFYLAVYSAGVKIPRAPVVGGTRPTVLYDGPFGTIFVIPGNSGQTIIFNTTDPNIQRQTET